MKKILAIIIIAAAAQSLYAQTESRDVINGIQSISTTSLEEGDKPWRGKGVAGINMSQASFSNWTAGGDASVAFDALLNYSLDYKKGKNMWSNRLEMAYGLNNTESNGLRKTNDKIYFSSSYGYELAKKLYLGAMLTFNTQFDRGFDYKVTPDPDRDNDYISKFMAPGYLTAGIGLIWTPYDFLRITYAPASWRGTFVMDDMLSDAGAFGVDPGKRVLHQLGSNLTTEFNKELWKNITLYSRLELYVDYLDNPTVDVIVHWDTSLNMKINRWLSANLNLNLVYDDNALARLQVKQVLGIGVQVNF